MKLMVIFKPLGGYRQFHMFLREQAIGKHNYFKNKFIRMPPRPRVRIGNLEGRLIAEQYQQHGPLWDIIVNGINRHPEFQQLPHNVQAIYDNHGRRNSVRRRVRDYVHGEVRQ